MVFVSDSWFFKLYIADKKQRSERQWKDQLEIYLVLLEFMNVEKRREVLENAGLDPDEYDF